MKTSSKYICALLASTAFVSIMPASAMAQTQSREQELEARLAQLEASVSSLRSELAATKAAQPILINQPAAPTAPAAPAEGYRVGNTTFKAGGFIKSVSSFSDFSSGEVAANALGRDFYLPGQIPTGTGRGSQVFDFSAKQTRLWSNLTSEVAGHTLKGYIEADFQTTAGAGSERTTNGYNFAVRRVYAQFDKFTIGQDWTTFQYTAALPESTDFVGSTEGTVFARQPLIRYTTKLNDKTTLHLSLENSETASATNLSTTLVENDDDKIPDFAARIQYAGSFGELSFAALARQLTVNNGTLTASDNGWGLSVGAKIPFGEGKRSDVRLMATYGDGIGRYVGLNYAPDAIFANGRLYTVENFAALAALRLSFSAKSRINLMYSYQDADYPTSNFTAGTFNSYNKSSNAFAANYFYSPVRGLDLGVEYRHATRELVNGVDGDLDRIEFAAKYSF